LIINWRSGEIVSRGFTKFFNLGEMEEVSIENLPGGRFEATNKLDGSLGIAYRDTDGVVKIATRGSFVSEQADWANKELLKYPRVQQELGNGVSLLFEIIYPENRIVLQYSQEQFGLWLIGCIDSNGRDFSYPELSLLGQYLGLNVVEKFEIESLDEVEALVNDTKGVEGWVIRFEDGTRVKVKTSEYVWLHRIISGLSPEMLRTLMLQDNRNALTEYIVELPDELYRDAERMVKEIQALYDEKYRQVEGYFNKVAKVILENETEYQSKDTRTQEKEFATQVQKWVPGEYHSQVFMLRKGKLNRLRDKLLRDLDISSVSKSSISEAVLQES